MQRFISLTFSEKIIILLLALANVIVLTWCETVTTSGCKSIFEYIYDCNSLNLTEVPSDLDPKTTVNILILKTIIDYRDKLNFFFFILVH